MFFLLFINTSIYLCAIYDLLITLCECGPYRDGWKFIFFYFKIFFYILKLFWCILGWSFSVRFGFYKKNNQTKIKKKTETGSNWPVSVWFFGQNRFKPVWLGFFRFWLGFFSFGSVRGDFFFLFFLNTFFKKIV